MKLKVGDKVVVRPRLQEGKSYGGLYFNDEMKMYRNKTLTIKDVRHSRYSVEENEWEWTDEMFTADSIKKALKDVKDTIVEFKVGDRIRFKTDIKFYAKRNTTGKLIDIGPADYGIEFDEEMGGHNAGGRGKDGHCWYFNRTEYQMSEYLEKINEEEYKKPKDDKQVDELIEELKKIKEEYGVESTKELSKSVHQLSLKIDDMNKQDPFKQAMIEAIIDKGKDLAIDDLRKRLKTELDDYIQETYGCVPKKIVIDTGIKKKEITGIFHKEFDNICKIVQKNIPLMLVGGAGAGKNHTLEQVAKALDLTFYTTNAINQDFKLTGFIDANGTYHETEFYKAFTKGGMFFLDEMDASCPEALIILNGAIANGYFDFPIGRVECHKDFRVVCAGNTYGTGADMVYVGRNVLDGATLDRFVVLQFDYDEEVEKQLAYDIDLFEFIRDLRNAINESGLRYIVSMRALINSTKMLEIGIDKKTILVTTIIKNMQRDDLNTILGRLNTRGDWYDNFRKLCD